MRPIVMVGPKTKEDTQVSGLTKSTKRRIQAVRFQTNKFGVRQLTKRGFKNRELTPWIINETEQCHNNRSDTPNQRVQQRTQMNSKAEHLRAGRSTENAHQKGNASDSHGGPEKQGRHAEQSIEPDHQNSAIARNGIS